MRRELSDEIAKYMDEQIQRLEAGWWNRSNRAFNLELRNIYNTNKFKTQKFRFKINRRGKIKYNSVLATLPELEPLKLDFDQVD